MYKIFGFLFLLAFSVQAQEFSANVTVDYSQIQTSSTTAFDALQKSLNDFINTTKWTEQSLKNHEKIEANFTIIIRERPGTNRYDASLLVQSRRPVYGTSYHTPILNISDSDFNFEYTEFEQLIFNPRRYSGKNLTDGIGFYIYLILGYDADTFQKMGGTPFFEIAQEISNAASSSTFDGWSESGGARTKTALINTILSPRNRNLRNSYYVYHRTGLDKLADNERAAKQSIGRSILDLNYYVKQNIYTQNYPLDIFFQAKKNEIEKIFGGGMPSSLNLAEMKQLLSTLSPVNSDNWENLK